MATIDIRKFESAFVIHFGGEEKNVSAYTLASALVAIADAARVANETLNPGYDIQVVVEAFGSGSFRATVRTIYTSAKNLFSNASVRAIVLGVIGNYVYQHTLAPDTDVKFSVSGDEVVIEQGTTKIIVPRNVHEAVKQLEKNHEFEKAISQVAVAIERDPKVESLGFSVGGESPDPPVKIPRERVIILAAPIEQLEQGRRYIEEDMDVLILKAILERTKRKWEFVWHGMRLAAPVLDDQFYDKFRAHKIMVAPGDRLKVRMGITQERSTDIGIFLNKSFEVLQVLEHVPGMEQQDMPHPDE